MFDILGRISHLRMLKISSHFLRTTLSTPQITPHISQNLNSIMRTPPPHSISLNILIKQLIRIKIRTISRQEEKPNLIPTPFYPLLYLARHMHRMLLHNKKNLLGSSRFRPNPIMPHQSLHKSNKYRSLKLLPKNHKSQFTPIRNRRDHTTPKPLPRTRYHRSFSLPTIRSTCLSESTRTEVIRPHPHLNTPENSHPLSFSLLLYIRILLGQPILHRLRIPLISPPQRLLRRKTPSLQIPPHRPNRKPDPKTLLNQIPYRFPGPKEKRQLQLVWTTIRNQTHHHSRSERVDPDLPRQQLDRRWPTTRTRTQSSHSLFPPPTIPLVHRLARNSKHSGGFRLTHPISNGLDNSLSQGISERVDSDLSNWRQKSNILFFHVPNYNTYYLICQTFSALINKAIRI